MPAGPRRGGTGSAAPDLPGDERRPSAAWPAPSPRWRKVGEQAAQIPIKQVQPEPPPPAIKRHAEPRAPAHGSA